MGCNGSKADPRGRRPSRKMSNREGSVIGMVTKSGRSLLTTRSSQGICKCVYFFVNSKSGGNEGKKMVELGIPALTFRFESIEGENASRNMDVRIIDLRVEAERKAGFREIANKIGCQSGSEKLLSVVASASARRQLDHRVSDSNVAVSLHRRFRSAMVRMRALREDSARSAASLQLEKDEAHIRIVACGGDGTVKWVLSELEKVGAKNVALAVVPFGTGNDMSRVLGWGPSAPRCLIGEGLRSLKRRVHAIVCAQREALDVWTVRLCVHGKNGRFVTVKNGKEVEESPSAETNDGDCVLVHSMINYFSIGADAEIVFEFEKKRKTAAWKNKMVYGFEGMIQQIPGFRPHHLHHEIKDVTSSKWSLVKSHESNVLKKTRALLWQNIPSYGGGNDIWGKPSGDYAPQRVGDGLLELMRLSSTKQVALHAATNGLWNSVGHLAQKDGYEVTFKDDATVFVQVDGEAFKCENAKSICITKRTQVGMLWSDQEMAQRQHASSDNDSIESASSDKSVEANNVPAAESPTPSASAAGEQGTIPDGDGANATTHVDGVAAEVG